MTVRYVVCDFETASRADLTKIGAWKYTQDFSTIVLCVQIKIVENDRPRPTRVLTEKQIHARDPELMELAADRTVMFQGHACGFEQGVWAHIMVPLGYPPIPPERWHDTMAVAAMKALPHGLDPLVNALNLPIKKDMEGHRHMLRMCKPDLKGGWSHHTPENLERLYQYGATDTEAQYGVYISTRGLGASERKTWIIDQHINQRGILIDREFVHACMDVLEQVRGPMTEEFRELTGLSPTQRAKVLDWVNEQGVPLGDMKKQTLDAILDPDDEFGIEDFQDHLPYNVIRALTLRRSLASSSVAKLQRMLDCACSDGRVRYATQYHGARTGRDAGRLIQVQNYPRGEISERQGLTAEILADAIMTRNVAHIKELWGDDIFSAIISSLRSCIVAEKGKVLVTGDYAGVEAKNLLSCAGQHDRAQQMHSGVDVYNEMASLIYKRPIDRKGPDTKEGQIGKNSVLGNGYGLGPIGFHNRFCPKSPFDLAVLAVNTYRRQWAPMVPQFWYGLFKASADAVWCDKALTYYHEGFAFRREGEFLVMILPSDRKIYYHKPQRETSYNPTLEMEFPAWSFMSYQGKKSRRHFAWHGQVTADAIQGLSRDLLMGAMKRCVKAGLNVVFKVHDELVLEEKERPGLAELLKQIMEDIEPWARQLRLLIKAETKTMYRYSK